MTDQAKIIDKIKKLLELAASPNPAEATLAYNRAKELMAKYSVDMGASENIIPQIVEIIYSPNNKSQALKDQLPYIAQAVGLPFGVHILVTRAWETKLVGFHTNVNLVAYALDSILNQCQADYRIKYKEYRTISFATNFWKGVRDAIIKRFEQEPSEQGLIVYDPVLAYMQKFTGSCNYKGMSSDGMVGQMAGMESGNAAQIRQGIGAAQRGNLIS